MYGRFDSPFPVSDRDTVVSINIEYHAEEQEMLARCENIVLDQVSVLPGVVRAPKVKVRARLRYIDDQHTFVDGIMDIDPGGNIPNWIVELVSNYILRSSLTKIRDRVKETRGQYEDFIGKYYVR